MAIYFFLPLNVGFLVFLTLQVIKARRKNNLLYGVGEHKEILPVVSAHSNFLAYTPLFLFQMYLLEVQKFNIIICITLYLVFFFGRLLHFKGMMDNKGFLWARILGMHLTLWPLFLVSVLQISLLLMSVWPKA
jgi:uncharacterized membrane protein YecN with MAPEG domain